jgi:hypothetical protein
MGFWKRLFGLEGKKNAKFDPFAVDGDGDGKVQDGTIWERPAALSVDLDATLQKAEELLKQVAPEQDIKLSEDLEKKRKRQEAAKKAAATRAKNKASKLEQVKADAERMAEATARAQAKTPAPKKTQPKKK